MASPVRVDLARAELPGHQPDAAGSVWPRDPQAFALAVYRAAQRIDEWAGESYAGTSVLAGAKVMRQLRLCSEYRWAFGAGDVRDTVVNFGPVVLGIPWYEGMYEAAGGEISPTGAMVGGHAILAHGYDPAKVVNGKAPRPMVRLFNSWGPDYGENGGGWITMDSLAMLLADQGEACVPVRRSYGRVSNPLVSFMRRLLGRR